MIDEDDDTSVGHIKIGRRPHRQTAIAKLLCGRAIGCTRRRARWSASMREPRAQRYTIRTNNNHHSIHIVSDQCDMVYIRRRARLNLLSRATVSKQLQFDASRLVLANLDWHTNQATVPVWCVKEGQKARAREVERACACALWMLVHYFIQIYGWNGVPIWYSSFDRENCGDRLPLNRINIASARTQQPFWSNRRRLPYNHTKIYTIYCKIFQRIFIFYWCLRLLFATLPCI